MVGQSLVKILGKKYNILTPSSKKLNLNKINNVKRYLIKEKPTHIVHLAGYIGGIGANINDPIRFLQENTLIGLNLIKAAHDLEIKNFLNIGSSCIYPPNQTKPNDENMLLNGKIESTNEGYALAKIMCIKMCEYISRSSSLNYFSLIPCNIYGPFDKFNEKNSHVMGSLIRKIHLAKHNNKKTVEIWGNGKAKREFIYVDDVALAIQSFLFKKKLPIENLFWLNIGSGIDYSITFLAKKIAKEFNYSGKFNYNLKKPNGAKSKLLNVQLSKMLGFKPKVKFNEGIKKTVAWYLKNYTSN
jgi:GDP-L-fucose synthase